MKSRKHPSLKNVVDITESYLELIVISYLDEIGIEGSVKFKPNYTYLKNGTSLKGFLYTLYIVKIPIENSIDLDLIFNKQIHRN